MSDMESELLDVDDDDRHVPRLKKPPATSFLLFHWSPVERRAGIIRRGLEPGRLSVCNTWRAPYTCFADSPGWAWALSAGIKKHHDEWDLWCVWSDRLTEYEEIPGDGSRGGRPHEIRVYHRIPKSALWFAGTRSQRGERAS